MKSSILIVVCLLTHGLWAQNVLKLNTDASGEGQHHPAMSSNSWGHTVVCWEDNRNMWSNVYAQIVNRNGVPVGENFRIHEYEAEKNFTNPNAAVLESGEMVLSWCDYRLYRGKEVFIRRFAANGAALGDEILVNDDGTSLPNGNGLIGCTREGKFVVVFADFRNGGSWGQVWGQGYNAKGEAVGANFQISEVNGTSALDHHFAINLEGQGVVVWRDGRDGGLRIYGQRLDVDGTLIGQNFPISPLNPDNDIIIQPVVEVRENGHFVVMWRYANGLHYREYNAEGLPIDERQIFISGSDERVCNDPALSCSEDGLFRAFWTEQNGEEKKIFFTLNLTSNQIFINPLTETGTEQSQGQISCFANRNMNFVCWTDRSSDYGDIHLIAMPNYSPRWAVAASGHAGMIPLSWEAALGDGPSEPYEIYRRDIGEGDWTRMASVNPGDRGPAGALMLDYIDTDVEAGKHYQYSVRTRYNGTSEVILNSNEAVAGSEKPQMNSPWTDAAPTVDGVLAEEEWQAAFTYRQQLDWSGSAVNVHVMNDGEFLYVAIDDSSDAVGQAGNVVGFMFDQDHSGTWPAVSPGNEGRMMLSDVGHWAQAFWGSYPNQLNGSVPASVSTGIAYAWSNDAGHAQYEVALHLAHSPLATPAGETLGFAVGLQHKGLQYPTRYGNVMQWPEGMLWESAETLGSLTLASGPSSVAPSPGLPGELRLSANYPNPFNPETVLKYALPVGGEIKMTVVDVTGRTVAELFSGVQNAGWHKQVFNANDLPSGVYFAVLEGEGRRLVQKMMLLR